MSGYLVQLETLKMLAGDGRIRRYERAHYCFAEGAFLGFEVTRNLNSPLSDSACFFLSSTYFACRV